MIRILLVDDSPLFCAQLRSMESWAEFGMMIVSEARNGLDAIAAIERDPPDVVLTDISMPLMDGVGLIEHVARYYPNMPVIALSAYDDFDYVRNSLRKGAQDYLLKHELDGGRLASAIRKAARDKAGDKAKIYDDRRSKDEFYRLVLSGKESPDEIAGRASQLGIIWPEKGVFPVMAGIDASEDGRNATFDVSMCEMLRGALLGSLFDCATISDDRLLILETAELEGRRTASQNEALYRAALTIERFFGVSLSYGVGGWCETLHDLAEQAAIAGQRFDDMRNMGMRGFVAQGSGEAQSSTNARPSRPAKRYGAYTGAAVEYIRKHYSEHISLKEIAAALNLNDSYLSRLFKAETGENIVSYLNAVRIDEAQRLLETTRLPIKEVASLVGIANYSHFFTLFKRIKGRTPADYRK